MAKFSEDWLAHQRQRWLRPNAHLWMKPGSANPSIHPSESKAVGGLLCDWSRNDQQQTDLDLDRALNSLRRDRAALRAMFEALKRDWRASKANFNPNQPRVPAGSPDGGQWTDGGGSNGPLASEESDSATSRILRTARRIIFASGTLTYRRCLDLCYPLLERFQSPGSDRNTWDFHKCMNACLGRNR